MPSSFDIRHWQPIREDARAILRVEEETFRDCPYGEERLAGLAGGGCLRTWIARHGAEPAGYVSGFETPGLDGVRWEVDLVAVRPAFRGQGLAPALIRASLEAAAPGALARAWVAVGNRASAHAFRKAGFAPGPGAYELWAYTIRGLVPRPPDPSWPPVGPAQSEAWAAGRWGPEVHAHQVARVARLVGTDAALWQAGPAAGCLALPVQTLHYAGLWLEEVWLGTNWRRGLPALLAHAVETAKQGELDEVGIMLPAHVPWRDILPAQGYGLVEAYRLFRVKKCPSPQG